jgi:hypothetical protein
MDLKIANELKNERLTPRYRHSHKEGPWIEEGYHLQAKGAESVIFISELKKIMSKSLSLFELQRNSPSASVLGFQDKKS